MVAVTDVRFMMHTIPHLVRTCAFPFVEKVLFVDTAPLSGDKVGRPGIGTMNELRDKCQQLINQGVIDRTVDIDYSPQYHARVYRKHFNLPKAPTHNYKGYPILGTIHSLEGTIGDYILHFDSDMLLYQKPGYDWITEGVKLLETCPEIFAIRPMAGPPYSQIRQDQRVPDAIDERGFQIFQFFGSRAYLVSRKRLDEVLPLPVIWRTRKVRKANSTLDQIRAWMRFLTSKKKLDSWEKMVTAGIKEKGLIRATMTAPEAWTLHPKARSPEFISALPKIIEKIESGWFPPEQAGYYDLKSEFWVSCV
jgi:hypothetical protein